MFFATCRAPVGRACATRRACRRSCGAIVTRVISPALIPPALGQPSSSCQLVGAVSWQSKLVGNASLSSRESEYMGFSMATQEVSFLRQLQLQMEGEAGIENPVRILVDSQLALDIVHNPVYHARSKQILAKYHSLRDKVFKEKESFFEKISAGQMGADMLTKHASVGVVRYNKKLIGMI